MKAKRYTEEQVIGNLKEHQAGVPAQDVIRNHSIANATSYGWESKFCGMEDSESRRLRELETENARLRKLLADSMLEETALEVVLQPEKSLSSQGQSRVTPLV